MGLVRRLHRYGPWWRHALEVDNASAPAYTQAVVTAVHNPPGTNDPDVVTSATGRVFVAQTPEALQYDSDGNLTQDGRFDYTWNGENRLIKAETRDDLSDTVPRVKVEYAYDHQGRMVWKQVSTNAVALSSRTFLWDGYNIIAEQVGRAVPGEPLAVATNHYVWGLDLSGSLQGAGGVGGLLTEVKDGEPCYAAFDANGNVMEYLTADGTLAAHYEYSPFGEIVVQSGDLADSLTHRFSTKPWCAVTGLSEYEFRKYSPYMGRWINRDPIGERGGAALYGMVANRVLSSVDSIGLAKFNCERKKERFQVGGGMLAYLRYTEDVDIETCNCCKSDGSLGIYQERLSSVEFFLSAGAGIDVEMGSIEATIWGTPYYLDLAFHISISTIGVGYEFSHKHVRDDCDGTGTRAQTICWTPSLVMGVESIGVGNNNLGLFAQISGRFYAKYCVNFSDSGAKLLPPEGYIDATVAAWVMVAGHRLGWHEGIKFDWGDMENPGFIPEPEGPVQ